MTLTTRTTTHCGMTPSGIKGLRMKKCTRRSLPRTTLPTTLRTTTLWITLPTTLRTTTLRTTLPTTLRTTTLRTTLATPPTSWTNPDRDIMRFRQFLAAQNHPEAFETLSAVTLDSLIATYIQELNKWDGGEYEPGTITGDHCSIDHYLREAEYEVNIMHSPLFKSSREMVEAKRRFLKFCGKGNGPNKAAALTEEELEKIWSGGGFSNTDPDRLVLAIWFLLALNFGLRGCHECRQLTVGDLSVKQHVSGQSYLEMVENTTKTRCGAGRGHSSGQRAFTPKAWLNGTSRCPVYYYNEYMRRRPDKMNDPSSPFFLQCQPPKEGRQPHLVCLQTNG